MYFKYHDHSVHISPSDTGRAMGKEGASCSQGSPEKKAGSQQSPLAGFQDSLRTEPPSSPRPPACCSLAHLGAASGVLKFRGEPSSSFANLS